MERSKCVVMGVILVANGTRELENTSFEGRIGND